jgi:hypothetical protein
MYMDMDFNGVDPCQQSLTCGLIFKSCYWGGGGLTFLHGGASGHEWAWREFLFLLVSGCEGPTMMTSWSLSSSSSVETSR